MPSIGDIANEAKALLEKIDANTEATKNNTASTDNHVVQLISTNQAGFTNLSQGMALQILLQKQTNQLLDLNSKQNDTIICWLKNIAEELCGILRNTAKEVELEKQLVKTLTHLDKIIELAHSREALEILKISEIESKMEKCCPEKEEPPVACFNECKLPSHPKMDPIDEKWEPIRYNTNKTK